MANWTCPYCRAYCTIGRCPKCGAFFEDKFDDVVEEETFEEMVDTIFDDPPTQTKTFEKTVSQKLETQIKTAKDMYPVTRRRRKKTQVFGVRVHPLLVGAIMIMFVLAFTQSTMFREISQVNFNEPDEPLFQLTIYAVWANKSNYNGYIEIRSCDYPVEILYMENGISYSDLIFNTNTELEFVVYDNYGEHFERVGTVSFKDKVDWEPRLYFDYPVILELSENW